MKMENRVVCVGASTRRQAIAGVVVSLGALITGAAALGSDDKARTSLHQEVLFKASPQRIYEILLDSKQFAAFTHKTAKISRDAGGAFSMFDGEIVGRNIELVPHVRLVQAWRPISWDAGIYSVVKFELAAKGAQTKVILDHTGFPEGDYGGLNSGWESHYSNPLEKYLG